MSLYADQWATVHHADATRITEFLAPKSVHTCVTSPPYWGLRSYLPAEDTHKAHELGAEPTPEEYVEALVEVFRRVWEVLRDDGTVFLNIGDSYAAGGMSNPSSADALDGGKDRGASDYSIQRQAPPGLKPKDLCMIPARVALALQQDGWFLRSEITWAKKAPMPESVTDRPTSATEKIFLLTKRPRYFYDAEAVKEGATTGFDYRPSKTYGKSNNGDRNDNGNAALSGDGRRNLRNFWLLGPEPFKGAHFAVFPSEIPARAIKAGTSEKGVCSECGAPWERIVERPKPPKVESSEIDRYGTGEAGVHRKVGQAYQNWLDANPPKTTGWQPTCFHSAAPVPATVLDPFMGSGTTAVTARKFGRRSVGLELDGRAAELIQKRMGYQEVLL